MEKPQLVNFIAKVLEDSGFRVYKNFKTSQQVIDIYAVLPTSIGDFGAVVACKNYDKEWEVGIDVLKEMEMIAKKLKASKVIVVTSSRFSSQATRYGEEKKMKLVDRTNLVTLAKRYSEQQKRQKEPVRLAKRTDEDENTYYQNSAYDQSRYEINAEDIENPYRSRDYNRVYNHYDNEEDYESDIDYYEAQVGGIDLSGYSEYDDDLYRAEFLNKSAAQEEILTGHRPILQSGQIQMQEEKKSRFKMPGRLSKSEKQPKRSGNSDLRHNYRRGSGDILSRTKRAEPKARKPIGNTLKPILSNIVVIIAIVVLVTYLIGFGLSSISKVPAGYIGLLELVLALIFSYGLTLYTERSSDVLIKGTIVFFVSLVILMIAMVAL